MEPSFVRVTFTDQELREIMQLAEARQTSKRAAGLVNQRIDMRRSPVEVEFVGILGEAAVGKYLGIGYDRAIRLTGRRGRQRVTHRVPGLFTLQVNYTRLSKFILNEVKDFQADYGILVVETAFSPQEVKIAGYIARAVFATNCRYENLGYGPRFTIGVDKLRPVSEIAALIPAPAKMPQPEQLGLFR